MALSAWTLRSLAVFTAESYTFFTAASTFGESLTLSASNLSCNFLDSATIVLRLRSPISYLMKIKTKEEKNKILVLILISNEKDNKVPSKI